MFYFEFIFLDGSEAACSCNTTNDIKRHSSIKCAETYDQGPIIVSEIINYQNYKTSHF